MTEAMKFLTETGWKQFKYPWEEDIPVESVPEVCKRQIEDLRLRDRYIAKFGFAIPDDPTIEKIRPYAPIVEIGAGSGYWSYELNKAGIEVIATDPGTGTYGYLAPDGWDPYWYFTEPLEGADAVRKYPNHTLLTVWPDLDLEWSYEALVAYTGRNVLYVDEGYGGCTGTDVFHEYLKQTFTELDYVSIPHFWSVHDVLMVFKRNPHRAIRLT